MELATTLKYQLTSQMTPTKMLISCPGKLHFFCIDRCENATSNKLVQLNESLLDLKNDLKTSLAPHSILPS